jgi:predicted transposase YdaD
VSVKSLLTLHNSSLFTTPLFSLFIWNPLTRAEIERSRDEEKRSREEERRAHEEAVSRVELERQRLRDTARNILLLGLSVEQVTQATGLPRETVQALAAQL